MPKRPLPAPERRPCRVDGENLLVLAATEPRQGAVPRLTRKGPRAIHQVAKNVSDRMPQPHSWRVQVWGEWRGSVNRTAASCRPAWLETQLFRVSRVYQAGFFLSRGIGAMGEGWQRAERFGPRPSPARTQANEFAPGGRWPPNPPARRRLFPTSPTPGARNVHPCCQRCAQAGGESLKRDLATTGP